jgi:prepilin-type N-terminal cleavage/methylation domain-containing protein
MKIKVKQNLGFTIMEMVVVISIVALVFTALLSLSLQGMQTNGINRNKIVAAQLAQEGIEIVRRMRDQEWLSTYPNPPSFGFGLNILDNNNYIVDYQNPADYLSLPAYKLFLQPFSDPRTFLYINGIGFYGHQVGSNKSNFRRYVQVKRPDADSLEVTCVVRYTRENISLDYKATEIMYNWYQ